MGNKNEFDIRKKIKDVKRELILVDIAIILLGLLLVIFPDSSNSAIGLTVGAVFCIWGLLRIIAYFRTKREEIFGSFALVQGAALLGFGIYFLVKPDVLSAVITVVLSIIIFIGGVVKLQYAFDFLRMESRGWWLQLMGAIVMTALGIVAFINPFGASNFIMVFIGISLMVGGVWDLGAIIYLLKKTKEFKKSVKKAVEKDSYIEADAFDENDDNNK